MSQLSLLFPCGYSREFLTDPGIPNGETREFQGITNTDNAKTEIHRTAGIARTINSLCYREILNGAIEQKQFIDTAGILQGAG